MLLKKIQIFNFRSIKDLTINVDGYNCNVLVGLNESGKSNILKALALLSPDFPATKKDIRIERPDDELIKIAHVRFIFSLNKNNIDRLYKSVAEQFSELSLTQPIFSDGDRSYTLLEFCQSKAEGLYVANLFDETKSSSYWSLGKMWSILPGWKKNPAKSSYKLIRNLGSNEETIDAEYFFIPEGSTVSPPAVLPAPTASDINGLIGKIIKEIIDENLPKCIYWEYKESNILPSSIDIVEFSANPDICKPLRSMFELAGYVDSSAIGKAINDARSGPPHIYNNLLSRVSKATTDHVRRVWKEYGEITIELSKNGNLVEPSVKDDQLALDFASRSDGFKRFVSFLLLISAKVRTETIQNAMLLVDEPEIGLHPSGAKNLRDELIEIGNRNYCFYSTHSIFMIDRNKIDRHNLVSKEKEITNCKKAEKSIVQDEEVIFNAIGFSIFEIIGQENLIFEGWRDKQLFSAAIAKRATINKGIRSKIGITHAEGVKDIKHIARLLELGKRLCYIISDADNAAKQHKSLFEKDHGWGTWVTYNDIEDLPKSYVTAEDFLTETYLIETSNKLRKTHTHLDEITKHEIAGDHKIKKLENWINKTTPEQERSAIISNLKDLLFGSELKHASIIDDYQHVINAVAKHFAITEQ